ncbi:MAG: SUMF1/EgtB/PvdO family nonheme iron enzyme [Verrucomicrobiales bacterium]|nr:SUMF1/EgtB/PvdO family nonheme iron enzyme [Verrucomicrobiales bacterium]
MSSSIPASNPGTPWQPLAPEDLQGELPAYEILGLLGRGGMGAVYRARQKSLNREVAIKVLPPVAGGDHSAASAERFKIEAQAMARLNHPGIVAVYDAGETPGGLLYFVMEMVHGTDVAQMIRGSGKLPAAHAHAIAAHVCDALAYAHMNGLIHRDIKPANIMVDTQGRVKVADFGVAKALDLATDSTPTNTAVGTPDFMAPEAWTPGMQLDGRADLYAVGVMLYQMLTGNIPRGVWRPVSVVVPGLDPRFDQILFKAMQMDREERHSSATDLRQDLDSLLLETVTAPELQQFYQDQTDHAPPTQTVPEGTGTTGLAVRRRPAKPKTLPVAGLAAAAVFGFAISTFVMFGTGKKPTPTDGTAASSVKAPISPPLPIAVAKAPEPPQAKPPEASPPPAPTAGGIAAADEAGKPVQTMASLKVETPSTAPVGPLPGTTEKPAAQFPPELAMLDKQFTQLRAERVIAPFEADLAKLNTSYLGGIRTKIAEEKASGHLNGILALEAEQEAVAEALKPEGRSSENPASSPVPDTDDEKTPPSLKALRAIYRQQFAHLSATQAASLQALIEPLDKRLGQMEADFTKADHLADAKLVRKYREALGYAAVPATGGAAVPSPARPGSSPGLPPVNARALKTGYTNSLGMKFAAVEGTEVMFCIHETRYKDYAAYAGAVLDVDGSWKDQTIDGYAITQHNEDHPVMNVSWEDAQAFCAWLSNKEGMTYRLPTDREWSIAAGIGDAEDWTPGTTPDTVTQESAAFPWGTKWPPPRGSGNYSDQSRKAARIAGPKTAGFLDLDDGYPTTAPVMKFKPNKFGLYDMGGNVGEWVGDLYDSALDRRWVRGATWWASQPRPMHSSFRLAHPPDTRTASNGFRVVLMLR